MDIYLEYGFSKEFTINVVKPGKSGADEIKQMMTDFRNNPPKELGGSKVVTWKDIKHWSNVMQTEMFLNQKCQKQAMFCNGSVKMEQK